MQLDLFDVTAEQLQKMQRLDAVVDRINRMQGSEKDAHYIRTLPIHHTQRELEPNVFELTLVPALDFDIYMRRYPGTTWKVVDAIVL